MCLKLKIIFTTNMLRRPLDIFFSCGTRPKGRSCILLLYAFVCRYCFPGDFWQDTLGCRIVLRAIVLVPCVFCLRRRFVIALPFSSLPRAPHLPRQVPLQSLPKFMGRIQACVGLGFVLGPMTMTILHRLFNVSTADTFYAAALFPLAGLLYAMFHVTETKVEDTGIVQLWRRDAAGSSASFLGTAAEAERRAKEGRERALASRERRRRRRAQVLGEEEEYGDFEAVAVEAGEEEGVMDGDMEWHFGSAGPEIGGEAAAPTAAAAEVVDGRIGRDVIPRAVMLLVGNGFLLMYAFSIETIYAMFLKVAMMLGYGAV